MSERKIYLIEIELGSGDRKKILIWSTSENDARKNAANIFDPDRNIYFDFKKCRCHELQSGVDYEILLKREWKDQVDIKGKKRIFISLKDHSDEICLMNDWPQEVE